MYIVEVLLMMSFQIVKEKYIEEFMKHIRYAMHNINSSDTFSVEEALSKTREFIDTTNTISDGVVTGFSIIGIAGIAAAPATFGASLGLPIAILAIGAGAVATTQVAYAGIKLINKTLQAGNVTESSEDTLRSRTNQITLEILCREIAEQIVSVQYRYFFEKYDITEGEIKIAAKYGAIRALKIIFKLNPFEGVEKYNLSLLLEIDASQLESDKLYLQAENDKIRYRTDMTPGHEPIILGDEDVLQFNEGLYNAIRDRNLAAIRQETKNKLIEIIRNKQHIRGWKDFLPTAQKVLHEMSISTSSPKESFKIANTTYYAKWIYSRPRAVKISQDGQYYFFKTKGLLGEKFSKVSTDITYGYMVLPQPDKQSDFTPTYQTKRSANPTNKFLEDEKQYLTLNYIVSSQDIDRYRHETEGQYRDTKESLNTYLSRTKFNNRPVIANCHDGKLQGVVLSGGNYDGVNFRRAILLDCFLDNTSWREAHLDCAELGKWGGWISLRNSVFDRCTAEKSIWRNVDFRGSSFKSSNMRASSLTSFIFSYGDFDEGANWFYSEFHIAYLSTNLNRLVLFKENEKKSCDIETPRLQDLFEIVRIQIAEISNEVVNLRREVDALSQRSNHGQSNITTVTTTNDLACYAIGYQDGSIYCHIQMQTNGSQVSENIWLYTSSFSINSLSLNYNCSFLMAGSDDNNIYRWDLHNIHHGNIITLEPLRNHKSWVTCVSWSIQPHWYLATCSDDFTVIIWDMSDLDNYTEQVINLKKPVFRISWSHNKRQLAVSFGEGKIAIIEKANNSDSPRYIWVHVKTLTRYPYPYTNLKFESLAWSPKSNYLAAANKYYVFLWDDEKTYVTYFPIVGLTYLIWQDEDKLLCASEKNHGNIKIYIWNKSNSEHSRTYETEIQQSIRLCHSNAIFFSTGNPTNSVLTRQRTSQLCQNFTPEQIFVARGTNTSDNPMHI